MGERSLHWALTITLYRSEEHTLRVAVLHASGQDGWGVGGVLWAEAYMGS